jgi:hypothetical protein
VEREKKRMATGREREGVARCDVCCRNQLLATETRSTQSHERDFLKNSFDFRALRISGVKFFSAIQNNEEPEKGSVRMQEQLVYKRTAGFW